MSDPPHNSSLSWKALRSLFFLIDPERAHDIALAALTLRSLFPYSDLPPRDVARAGSLSRTLFGIRFPNLLGLAAGFDKNAEALPAWQRLGFGYIEVGTVTPKPQPGNPKPRVFRFPQDQAIINRLGFNNLGAKRVCANVARWRKQNKVHVPIGINLGKGKETPLKDAPHDYRDAFLILADLADYITVNVSSPNTVGLRDLQGEDQLRRILDSLSSENQKRTSPRPLLLKLAPDLSPEGAVAAGRVALEHGLAGLIVSNTTLSRNGLSSSKAPTDGGLSGHPLSALSTRMLKDLRAAFGSKFAYVGVGGIMNGEDAQKKIDAGADLLQSYTGFVYGGPTFPRRLLNHLL